MPFNKLTVQNYRAFRDPVVFNLRQLTLVFGENNAGKSSLVRLLPSFANSCDKGAQLAFSPVTPAFGQVTSLDYIFGRQISQKLYIGANFLDQTSSWKTVRYEIASLPELNASVVSRITFLEGDKVLADFQWDATPLVGNDSLAKLVYIAVHRVDQDAGSEPTVALELHGLLPEIPEESHLESNEISLFVALRSNLLELVKKIHWLGPLRHTPERIERLVYTPQSMSQTGKEAAQILAESHARKSPLFTNVSAWFEKVLGHRLVIVEGAFEGDNLFSLALSPVEAPNIRIPISDAGTGMSQVLPIILMGEQAAMGLLGSSPILVFENPELHLHDSIHDDLGRFFVKVISSPSTPSLVIETHSENILLALQIAIAQGRTKDDEGLNCDATIINWVKKLPDGASVVDAVVFDEKAVPSEQWPSDAFSTAPTQSRQLFAIRTVGLKGGM